MSVGCGRGSGPASGPGRLADCRPLSRRPVAYTRCKCRISILTVGRATCILILMGECLLSVGRAMTPPERIPHFPCSMYVGLVHQRAQNGTGRSNPCWQWQICAAKEHKCHDVPKDILSHLLELPFGRLLGFLFDDSLSRVTGSTRKRIVKTSVARPISHRRSTKPRAAPRTAVPP